MSSIQPVRSTGIVPPWLQRPAAPGNPGIVPPWLAPPSVPGNPGIVPPWMQPVAPDHPVGPDEPRIFLA